MVELGLIGYPLGHSFSADLFNGLFEKNGIYGHYSLFPISSIETLPEFLKSNPSLSGFNVTIPYKKAILPYLDFISEDAKEIGAVNVVKIENVKGSGNLRLSGYNTDWKGFKESLVPHLRLGIDRALLLGTGGASKAVAYALNNLGISVTFVSRQSNEMSSHTISYSDLNKKIVEDHRLVVNTTPLGMYPLVDTAPDFPYQFLSNRHLCYDLVYNPEHTKFMDLSRKFGARVKNGLEMLYLQAKASAEIWNLPTKFFYTPKLIDF